MMMLSFDKISGYDFSDSKIYIYYRTYEDALYDYNANTSLNMVLVYSTVIIDYDPVYVFELGLHCDTVLGQYGLDIIDGIGFDHDDNL